MLLSHLPPRLRVMSLFEDFNEDYPHAFQNLTPGFPLLDAEIVRTPDPSVGAALAQASLGLEKLSSAFNVDAESFFQAVQPSWTWDRLETLVLTSRLLSLSNHNQSAVTSMLCNASVAALRMPKLQVLEIWSGYRHIACLFRYHPGSVLWKSTNHLTFEPQALHAWETVALTKTGVKLRVDNHILNVPIDSHGSAIHHLGLSPLVVHPNSLQQIRREIENSTSS